MTNREAQRDAQRARRREERQQVKRDLRRVRQPVDVTIAAKRTPEPPPPRHLPWAWIAVGSIAGLLLIVGLLYVIRQNAAPLPGKVFAAQGNVHVQANTAHPAYNSNPPTSGWHYDTWPKRGIYTDPLPEEWLLHFQEHAGVVVHYNPDKLPQDQLTQLRSIVNSELDKNQGLVVLAPDPAIPDPIDLTAWQHLEAFNQVNGNKAKMQDFIERLQCNYDPEGVCGPPHGAQSYPTGTPGAGVATVVGQPISSNAPTATVAPGQRLESQTPVPGSATP
ncbi:MAG: DUF3105 domain-containing protein [Dehalococcoidia bacterium]